jgi:hypothetical protein
VAVNTFDLFAFTLENGGRHVTTFGSFAAQFEHELELIVFIQLCFGVFPVRYSLCVCRAGNEDYGQCSIYGKFPSVFQLFFRFPPAWTALLST